MSKSLRKGKSPKRQQGGQGFDENALAQLTSKIDGSLDSQSLSNQKRKKPPTDESEKHHSKKPRGPEDKKSKSTPKVDQEVLLAEIRALGGDEKDLDLINDVDSSDEEIVNDKSESVDKKLKQELLALSKELGFDSLAPQDDEQDVENEDEDEEDDEDEEEDEEEEEEEEKEEKVKKQEERKETKKNKEVRPEINEGTKLTAEKRPSRKIGNLTFEPRADWHATELAELPAPAGDHVGPFAGVIETLKRHAQTLLDDDSAKYRTSVFASSSHKFLSTIMSSGTLTDKVSALTLAIQESPVHNVRAFDALMSMASKKSRAQTLGAVGALVDLLGPGTLLPSDRRLRTFHTQPGLLGCLQRNSIRSWTPGQPLPSKLTAEHLISWVYEDWLKATYFKIIQLLEGCCSDEIEYSRLRAVDFVYALLKDKPEQESNLLTLLVNKLGDRDRKIASRASYLLLQLQTSHPGMKPIIVRNVEQSILLHPAQDHRSKYYAINTLNQTILSSKEPDVAVSLIRIYFSLFVTMLKTGTLGISEHKEGNDRKKSETRPEKSFGKPGNSATPVPETEAADKLVSAILTGVNRAAPFVGADDTIMEQHLDTLFKIAHSANFNTGIQALLLIQHLSSARNLATDRFYRTMYESLLDPRLVTSSKQSLYLNLLLRALKDDVDVRRVKAFAKRMLQIAGLHQPPFVCGLLYVISQLRETFPDLSTLVNDPEESVFDDEADSAERPAYDGRKRNPEFSNAHRSCLWELTPILTHFHPSVNVIASALLSKDQKMPKPDLDSHSLIKFLDKFVYRTPKSTDSTRGASIMQPLRATKDLGDVWLGSRGAGVAAAPVNSASFWKKKIEDVAAEDVFFHEYFQHVTREPKKGSKAAAPATGASGEEDEAEDSDDVWEALVKTQPEIDGEGSDLGFDDLDELEMASVEGSSPALSLENDSDDDLDMMSDDDSIASDGLVAVGVNDGDDEEDDDDLDEDEKARKAAREEKKSRRKAIKNLPMFASVDDYAELLAGEEDM